MVGVLVAALILGSFFAMRHRGSSRRRLLQLAVGTLLSSAWLRLCELVLLG
jgi:hypothetical protein